MRTLGGLGVVILMSMVGAASAQPRATVPVKVEFGPAVADRMDDLGGADLRQQAQYLQTDVERLVIRRKERPAQIDLVISDIEPNRPTSAQLGASTQLRQSSFGLGGAAITGQVVLADGRRLPVRYRFFPDLLRDESNFTTWGDADEAFDNLASLIAAGRVPNDPNAWPSPHVAHAMTGTRIPG